MAQDRLELVATNLTEVSRGLREVGDKVQRREFTKDLRAAVEPVIEKARSEAPVRTGRLRASIKPYASGAGIKPYVRFGSRLPYANVINWGGTTGRGHSRRTPGATRIKPNNFMQRAVDAKRDEAVIRVEQSIMRTARQHGF
jgi:phage gpG-like protein